MIRDEDVSGISGVGWVADVVEFENGKCVVAWLTRKTGDVASVSVFDSLEEIQRIHGHDGSTWLERRNPKQDEPDEGKPPTYRAARMFGRKF